jgi:hypothetical protein
MIPALMIPLNPSPDDPSPDDPIESHSPDDPSPDDPSPDDPSPDDPIGSHSPDDPIGSHSPDGGSIGSPPPAVEDDDEVSTLALTGRLDGWPIVLKYDATVGMQLALQEVYVEGDEAYTTAIEFPSAGGSLLCTQRWVRREGAWRVAQHRTIPYSEDRDAAACLRCDHRGCVALERLGAKGPSGMPGDGKA